MIIKRTVEILLSFILLILFSPSMGVMALAIIIDSAGPAIFKQKRVGYQGKIFTLYKFRSMYCIVDPQDLSPVGNGDARVTRVGRFLRKFKLDELPQLFNIIKGDMSFVGPRPQLLKELNEFQELYPGLLQKRLTVTPGLTGLWAIKPGTIKNKPSHEMLVEDCRYVDNATLWMDIKIVFKTFIYLLSSR